MLPDATHRQPIVHVATKKGRRMFLLAGSLGFVVFSTLLILIGLVLLLAESPAQLTPWFILLVGITGLVFFGAIAIGMIKHHWGAQGNTSLTMSPVGFTDRTQIVGPLPLIPWSIIAQYDIVDFMGQPILVLQIHDVAAFKRIIAPFWILRLSFKANAKLLGAPAHTIALDHLQISHQELLGTIYHLTGRPPGVPGSLRA